MVLAPDVNSGSYFNDQDRSSRRVESLTTYAFSPLGPAHLVKAGAGITFETFDGVNRSRPIDIVREDGTVSQEITFVGLFEGHVKWSVLPHVLLALGALAVLVVQRKRLPLSWLVFGALYLIPSLQLGMVGVGRYANECFPPFVGIGQLLDRWSSRVRALYFAASTVGLVLFAAVAARYDLVP